jgi:protein involved in polysaccharide export with SLBB domain
VVRIVISVFILLIGADLLAQVIPYDIQLQAELDSRGVSYEELATLLAERGIDISDLQTLSPSQLGELQRAIEQIEYSKELNGTFFIDSLDSLDTLGIEQIEVDSLEELELVPDTTELEEYAIYGQQIINRGILTQIPETGYNPPSYYKIGTGDIISVSIFGVNQLDELHDVLSDGSVMIREGRVKVLVRGLTLAQVREKLKKNYRRQYRFNDGEFSVDVSSVRSVTVQVFGEVARSGSYTVPAINSIINILGEAGGLTDLASVRAIKLIKKDGSESLFDLYELLANPGTVGDYFLEDGDLIFVPSYNAVVDIEGAIKRPDTYEILDGEGIVDLIKYGGGLNQVAYTTSMRVLRYEDGRRVVKSIPYASLIKSRSDYELFQGDVIKIDSISAELENFVSVVGEVRHPGVYERLPNMKLSDLLNQGQLKVSSKTDFAFLRRTNSDGQISMIPLNLDDVLATTDPLVNIELKDKDELTIWPKERFTDEQYISIAGAVRNEEKISYDVNGGLKASDVILMAGGLRRDANTFAHLHRLDPLNPGDYEIIGLDLENLMGDDRSADNIVLEPFDSIYVYSKNSFYDEINITISGAVNNPGEFAYGAGMSLRDAIVLAGGFRRSSATNAIEVSRVIVEDNQKTQTIVNTVTLHRDELTDFGKREGLYELQPYDNIFVRFVPEFELQQNVTVNGEVTLPGEYSLILENETVYDIIKRAGGLTEEAFPAGATLYRSEDSLGFIVMRLEEILVNNESRYNYTLKNGDVITLPKRRDYVTIAGATNIQEAQNQEIVGEDNSIRVPFHRGKTALFYINEYAGGFADNARRDKVWVTYPNGEVKTTERKFPFGKKHPEVLQGSVINVGRQPVDLYGKSQEQDVNWTQVLGDSVAQAMSILTLVLLIQRLD